MVKKRYKQTLKASHRSTVKALKTGKTKWKSFQIHLSSENIDPLTDIADINATYTLAPRFHNGEFYAVKLYSIQHHVGTVSIHPIDPLLSRNANVIGSLREHISNEKLSTCRKTVVGGPTEDYQENDFYYDSTGAGGADSIEVWNLPNGRNEAMIFNEGMIWNYSKGIIIDPQIDIIFQHGGSGNVEYYNNDVVLITNISYELIKINDPIIKRRVR